jgi:CheY-like chemotaxis protein
VATILCIDDQTYALAARVEWLRAHGHMVVLVGSPQAALDSLLTNPIQAAVLDCHMSGAFLIAGLMKRIRPDLPFIMLASYCGVPCHQQGVVTACIGKGESPATLLHTLQSALGADIPGQAAA